MDSGSRSDIEASDIATSESRSEDWGKGTSLSCLAFYETKRVSQTLVTRLYAARTSLTVGAASSSSSSNFLLKAMAVDGGDG